MRVTTSPASARRGRRPVRPSSRPRSPPCPPSGFSFFPRGANSRLAARSLSPPIPLHPRGGTLWGTSPVRLRRQPSVDREHHSVHVRRLVRHHEPHHGGDLLEARGPAVRRLAGVPVKRDRRGHVHDPPPPSAQHPAEGGSSAEVGAPYVRIERLLE